MTDSCNLHCPFCYVKQRPANLDPDKAIAFIKEHQPINVIFHGGEPLLRAKDILKIMDALPEIHDFSITSNLMLPLTEERLEVLQRCGVATSYSVDRFHSKEELLHFKTAVDKAKTFGEVTLLVTLSKAQLECPPEELCKTLRWLDVDYINLERLRDDSIVSAEEYEKLYQKTDEYLFTIFSKKLIPDKKNVLLSRMIESIKTNTPVFFLNCREETTTLLTDGKSTTSCPNGDLNKEKKLKECLFCDLKQFCMGDCPSFGKFSCSFPKKTFNYIRGGLS